MKALRAAEDELWTRSRDHHRSGTLDELLAAAGANPDADALARLHGWWDQHTITDPEAAPMFEALRSQGLRIGVLSNTIWSRERHEAIFARDGLSGLIDGDGLLQRDRVDQTPSACVPSRPRRGRGG